jgi:hypothetical protein
MPFLDLTNFNPSSNIEQRHYSNSGVIWPGTIVASSSLAISPGTWKSGYPNALSPFDWFVWFDVVTNFKLEAVPGGAPCTRYKQRTRVFLIDPAGDDPQAVDVTEASIDWPSTDLNGVSLIYDPASFTVETVSSVLLSGTNFEECDCELPEFLFPGEIPLVYGHSVAPKVFFGSMEEVVE